MSLSLAGRFTVLPLPARGGVGGGGSKLRTGRALLWCVAPYALLLWCWCFYASVDNELCVIPSPSCTHPSSKPRTPPNLLRAQATIKLQASYKLLSAYIIIIPCSEPVQSVVLGSVCAVRQLVFALSEGGAD